MNRRQALAALAASGIAGPALATQSCDPYGRCSFGIDQARLPHIDAQQTPVWCWAATTQAIFRYYGHEVQQGNIVASIFGEAIPINASPDVMLKVLNQSYVDSQGVRFTASTPRFVDGYGILPGGFSAYGMQTGLSNPEIFAELAAERPLFYADGPHAMVLVGGSAIGPNPTSGWVLDPEPVGGNFAPGVPATGLRQLAPNEMTGFFIAKVVVS